MVVVTFSLLAGTLGEYSSLVSPTVLFFFFLSGDWLAHTDSTLLCQDQSIMAQRAEMTVGECSLTSCV